MSQTSTGLVNPAIFESLQAKIDEDIEFREQVRQLLQTLEKQRLYASLCIDLYC